MSADDFFVRRYAAELQKTFDPDVVSLTYGAPHEGRMTLASALDAKDAWRDDTYLSIVWLSDPRSLDETPRPARLCGSAASQRRSPAPACAH